MPKVSYSEGERERIRKDLVTAALALMSRQGIQHTTVEQIYKAVGISRTFFYKFFSTKEELVLEAIYFQQPKIIAYVKEIMEDPALSWRVGVETFLRACCYGEQSGIAVLTIEEQQMLFCRLSPENYRVFREKQVSLFKNILASFGLEATPAQIGLFTNLSLSLVVLSRAVPDTLPLFVPEAVDETVNFQIRAIVDALEMERTS